MLSSLWRSKPAPKSWTNSELALARTNMYLAGGKGTTRLCCSCVLTWMTGSCIESPNLSQLEFFLIWGSLRTERQLQEKPFGTVVLQFIVMKLDSWAIQAFLKEDWAVYWQVENDGWQFTHSVEYSLKNLKESNIRYTFSVGQQKTLTDYSS